MLLSLAVLAGFQSYWIHAEYLRAHMQLRKDLQRIAGDVRSALADSLLMANLILPLEQRLQGEGIDTASGVLSRFTAPDTGTLNFRSQLPAHPVSLRISYGNDSAEPGTARMPERLRMRRNDSNEIFYFRKDSVSRDSFSAYHRNVHRVSFGGSSSVEQLRILRHGDSERPAGADSFDATLTRGVRLLLQTISNLPAGAGNQIALPDTGFLNAGYARALDKAGIPVGLRWRPVDTTAARLGLVVDEIPEIRQMLIASSYRGHLLRLISPQLGFSLFLLCFTALAFGMTFRALRSQMQLAAIRNDFISNMSHELKTPVSTVKVALEAVSEPAVLADRALAGEYLEMAGLELGRLELLINQALQSAMLDSGRLHMERTPVELGGLVRQMVRVMQGRFGQASGSLSLNAADGRFIIAGDALHLQGVIVNILDNALKYAGPAPQVRMELGAAAGTVSLRIIDRGPGIPPEYHARVFDKFFRVPKGNEHSVKGYGLGLNYAAQVIRAHGGSIRVSDTPGGGCTFELHFPGTQS